MKSILSYGVVGLLSAALLGGSAFILLNPTQTRAERDQGRGQVSAALVESGPGHHGNGAETPGSPAYGLGEADKGRGGPGKGASGDNGSGNSDSNGRGQGGGGQRQNGTTVATEWETLSGTVIGMDGEVTLETAEGDQVVVGLGQSKYREEMSFALEVGDQVVVIGFYEEGEFKAGTIENLTTEETVLLRDETGRPMWAGRGQLKNQGQGGS